MGGYDLNAAKAARAEKLEDRYFEYGDPPERFDLPAEISYDAVLAAASGDLGAIMAGLLGEEGHARFRALGPSAEDVNDLVGWLMPEYGLGDPTQNGASGEPDPKSPPS